MTNHRLAQLLADAESARRTIVLAASDAVEQPLAAAAAFWRAASAFAVDPQTGTDFLAPIVGERDPRGAAAARVLATLATPRAIQALLDAAYSVELATSQRALVALLGVPRSEVLAQMMIERYRREPDDPKSMQLLDAIARQPCVSTFSFGLDILASSRAEDSLVRFIAAAGRNADAEAGELAERALSSPLQRVRLAAAWVLLLRGKRRYLDILLAAAAKRQPALREYAMLACAGLPFRECVPLVAAGLADSSNKVRMAALLAAPLVGDRDLVEPAAGLLGSGNRQVTAQAEAAFRDLTGEHPPPTVREGLTAARAVAAAMQPATRYFRGRPLAASMLVELLLSSSHAPSANSNLIASAGRDFEFDPGQDLIGNLASFEKWRTWLTIDGNTLVTGRRYYYGREV